MRPLLIIALVFAAGIVIGHDFWPQSHPDPMWHFRFHRGKMPPFAEASPSPGRPARPHGRILQHAEPDTGSPGLPTTKVP